MSDNTNTKPAQRLRIWAREYGIEAEGHWGLAVLVAVLILAIILLLMVTTGGLL